MDYVRVGSGWTRESPPRGGAECRAPVHGAGNSRLQKDSILVLDASWGPLVPVVDTVFIWDTSTGLVCRLGMTGGIALTLENTSPHREDAVTGSMDGEREGEEHGRCL